MDTDLSKLSKEERRKVLRQRLRSKINSKAGHRMTKRERDSQINKATEQLSDIKDSGIEVDKILHSMIPDARSRKINKKRLKKFLQKKKEEKKDNKTEDKQNEETK